MTHHSGQQVSDFIFTNKADASVRPASYDLRVGCITVDGEEYKERAWLEPYSTAIFTSLEEIRIPPGYVAYAFPKTSLCNKGIHVLNTGLIDPGYSGPLSSIALNFHKDKNLIEAGDVFLRIVIHEINCELTDQSVSGNNGSVTVMSRANRERSKQFPNSFLDVPGQLEKIASKMTDRSTNKFLWILTIFTAIFALYSYFGPALSQFAPGYWTADRDSVEELRMELESIKATLRELDELNAKSDLQKDRLRKAVSPEEN